MRISVVIDLPELGVAEQSVATPSQIRAAGEPIQVQVTGSGHASLDRYLLEKMSEIQIQMARGRRQFTSGRW